MQELRGKVAVVTGAASGIGGALAERFVAEGMAVALADVEEDALAARARALASTGARVLAVRTDVSRAADVEALAEHALAAFGAIHVVCNNAGVFTGGLTWEAPLADYEWVLGVNVWGVIHGIRTFVPILLRQGTAGHIVNTASMAGLTAMPYAGIYHMSKHAVIGLSECLHHELTLSGALVKVSVLCPEMVATHIDAAERNRPAHLRLANRTPTVSEEVISTAMRENIRTGAPPAEMAERVVQAIRAERFYVLSDDIWRRVCETRLDDIRAARNPTFAAPV